MDWFNHQPDDVIFVKGVRVFLLARLRNRPLFIECPFEFSNELGGGFKDVLFSPRKLGKIPILTSIFFKGVGSTTN